MSDSWQTPLGRRMSNRPSWISPTSMYDWPFVCRGVSSSKKDRCHLRSARKQLRDLDEVMVRAITRYFLTRYPGCCPGAAESLARIDATGESRAVPMRGLQPAPTATSGELRR